MPCTGLELVLLAWSKLYNRAITVRVLLGRQVNDMAAEWFKQITDVLADQLFILQMIRTRAAERKISVTDLLDHDRTCDGTFLAFSELQEIRRLLITRFDDCPVKFKWNVLYCLCVVDVLIAEVFVDENSPARHQITEEVMTRAANTRDLDALVSEWLLFDFFWRTDEDLLDALRTAVASTCILCTQRSLAKSMVFAPIPCVQCRFDHAFSPETEIVKLPCSHLASSVAPMPPDAGLFFLDLPTPAPGSTNDKTVGTAITACQFPVSDGAFDQLGTADSLADKLTSLRSSTPRIPPAARSATEAHSRLMCSKVLRDCKEERAELASIRSQIRAVAGRRKEASACKALNEWMLLRLVELIDALARRISRSNLVREIPPFDQHFTDGPACDRLRRNLRGMILQDTELKQIQHALDDLMLDPLTRASRRIFRPYIDMRKFMWALSFSGEDILAYDRWLAEVTNKNVFEMTPRHPRDRFLKAVFVSGLFRLYMNSIGCSSDCVPALFRADDNQDRDGFCFSVDGGKVAALVAGRCIGSVKNETILLLCISWIRALLQRHATGEAADSLRHLLDSTTI